MPYFLKSLATAHSNQPCRQCPGCGRLGGSWEFLFQMGGLAVTRFQSDRLSIAIKSHRILEDRLRRVLSNFRWVLSRAVPKVGFFQTGRSSDPLQEAVECKYTELEPVSLQSYRSEKRSWLEDSKLEFRNSKLGCCFPEKNRGLRTTW
jgi:hypothetical protein